LSAETLAGITEFFKSVDADGSGSVNKSELKEFLTKAGAPAEEIDATAEQVLISLLTCLMRCESMTHYLHRSLLRSEAMTASL
jgi:hypothetical protein